MNVTITRSGTPPKVIAERLPRAINAGVNEVTRVAHVISAARIALIYRRRIPTYAEHRAWLMTGRVDPKLVRTRKKTYRRSMKGGKAMWRRYGELRKSLWSATTNNGGWTSSGVVTHNKGIRGGVYGDGMLLGTGRSRHGLASGGSDSWGGVGAAGVIRKNPWFQETAERLEPQILRQFDKGFQRRMGG